MADWPSKQQETWFQAGVTAENLRIIKLLENREPSNITSEQDNFWSGYQMAIALIKGEK